MNTTADVGGTGGEANSEVLDQFESPESSNIRGARYYLKSNQLYVTFVGRKGDALAGRVYRYDNFPEALWDGFKASTSKGAFHAKHIRWNYQGVPV